MFLADKLLGHSLLFCHYLKTVCLNDESVSGMLYFILNENTLFFQSYEQIGVLAPLRVSPCSEFTIFSASALLPCQHKPYMSMNI